MILQDLFFGAHSRRWLGWIFLIPCFRLSLLWAVLALLPFCTVSLVSVGQQWKDQGIPEAGLHCCTCGNLFVAEVALHGCCDSRAVTAGTSAVSAPACPLSQPLMRPSPAPSSLQLSNSQHEHSASEQPAPVLFIHLLEERGSGVHYTAHFQNQAVAHFQTNTQNF